MPDFRRTTRRLEAKALPWLGTSSGVGYQPWVPGARFDFSREAGNLADNSLVRLGLDWIKRNVTQGRIVCGTEDGGDYNEAEDHPLTRASGTNRDPAAYWAQDGPGLLARPNPFESWTDTLGGTVESLCVDGNAYWIKSRDRLGDVMEIYWVPNQQIEIDPETDADRAMRSGPVRSYWLTSVGLTTGPYRRRYAPADVVHFRSGIDPYARWLGLSGLKRQIRNIVSIAEGERYTAAILRNAHAGKVLAPKDKPAEIHIASPDESEMQGVARQMRRGISGENVGTITPVSLAVDLLDVGLGPEQMTLDRILDRPQSYVLSSLGLNVLALNISGAENVSTFANKESAHREAWENAIIPRQDLVAETIRRQLLPDFAESGSELADAVWWDRRDVHALKEDANERATRSVALRAAGILTQNEARALVDQPPQEEGDATPQEEADSAMERQQELGGMQDMQNMQDAADGQPKDEAADV